MRSGERSNRGRRGIFPEPGLAELRSRDRIAVTWQPISTAPSNQRILVCGDRGHVKIARQGKLRWYDDAESLIARPVWWMPLPAAPSDAPVKEPEGKARRRYR
jgi:hypothetical protein